MGYRLLDFLGCFTIGKRRFMSRVSSLAGLFLLPVFCGGFLSLAAARSADAQVLEGPGALFLDQTPIEMMASNYSSFETGYLLPKGAVYLQFGSDQTLGGEATGTQVYEGRADWAISDRFHSSIVPRVRIHPRSI